ncbi:MAG: hypothetical protein GWN84_22520, partial [Gammaproteobacteria bacterium]|nr:hypothetical protein [Gammaproteobacteria bacterium]NIU06543.1 hypothetical protein [Gammaproteobacteria bacterium]NIV53432.1 hypothetical protein [Gammaproteobacteria bacterium]NIW85410.1 hypothetical protein [Gammaproteobacteria bacterium]NIX87816.1 hypothetical protein [Gammaproteobacteria bacterium]
MIRTRLLRTNAFRLSLLYACVFSLAGTAALAFTYWSTAEHMRERLEESLRAEAESLLDLYRARGPKALVEAVQRRSSVDASDDEHHRGHYYRLHYLLQAPDDTVAAGDPASWSVAADEPED